MRNTRLIIPSVLFFFFVGTSSLLAQTGPAPEFSLPTPDGSTISLSSYKGKIVILDFWAIFCPPCRAEIPGFIDIYSKYKDKGVEIIGISLDKESGKIKTFVQENNINYPIVIASKDVQNDYGKVQAIPTTFILDRDLNIVKKHVGFTEKASFEAELDELLKASPAGSPATFPANPEPTTPPASIPAPTTPASTSVSEPAPAPAPASPSGQP